MASKGKTTYQRKASVPKRANAKKDVEELVAEFFASSESEEVTKIEKEAVAKKSRASKSKIVEKKINTDYRQLFGSLGNVENEEKIYGILHSLSGLAEIDVDTVNASAENMSKLYFRETGTDVSEQSNASNIARYMFVDTGLKGKSTDETIYASFYKDKLGWQGAYIGFKDALVEKIKTYNEEVKSKSKYAVNAESAQVIEKTNEVEGNTEAEAEEEESDEFCKELYDMLLKKEKWSVASSSGCSRLRRYIYALMSKIKVQMRSHCGEGYITNVDGNKIIYNTGLFDKYMNYIYAICDYDSIEDKVYGHRLVESKNQLVTEGFEKADIKCMPKAVTFCKNVKSLIFDADIDDFDLSNRERIEHIIEERLFRFPEKWRSMPKDVLYEKVVGAVKNSLKMQARDYKYIIPMYNIEFDAIQYLMPLHLDNNFSEAPELVLIVGKYKDFYNLMTIICTSDAYDNARVVAPVNSEWLYLDK